MSTTQQLYESNVLSQPRQQKDIGISWNLNEDLLNKFKETLPKDIVLSYLTSSEFLTPRTEEQLSSETVPFDERGISPIVQVKLHRISQDNFISLQKWEGIVLKVGENSFLARLIDQTKKGPDEEAEFSLDEVSEYDKRFVEPGAIFYWNIGYHDSSTGQRRRTSMIRFRRMPAWRREELAAAKKEAKIIRSLIDREITYDKCSSEVR